MQIQPQKIKQVILDVLGTASQIALNYFRQPVSVEVKADDSPVTQADREIEQAIRNMLNDHFPPMLSTERNRVELVVKAAPG